nr:M20/M25/M40 family metallo-hydrolase [Candidatus Neomarinimicrobiota bacterium]
DPEDNPHGIFSEHNSLRKKTLVARDHGAAGILFLSGPEFDETDELIPLVYDQSQSGSAIHAIHIKRSVANRIIKESGYTISQLEQRLISDRKPVSFIVQEEITASTDLVKQTVTTQNIAGILYGSDPRLKGEMIVIGAHYDHLGFGGAHSGSRRPDTLAIHNGADDNASGVAAILEIIEKLKAEQTKLKRSILFLSFGAEEMGLLGSKYFVNNPLVDLEKIKLMFNLDMVGRLDSTTKAITVGGTGTAVGLSDLVQRFAEGEDLNVKLSSEGYGPSDHTSFYVENIPVLFFFTGVHEDYHTPEDDVEKINLSGEILVAEFVHDLIIEAANVPESLVYQEAGPKEQPSGRRRFKVTLGIMPDYSSEEGEGLRVDGVINNKPAKRAGMEKGDVIVAMDGKPVKNIYDYMYRLEECKPGQRINVDVLRNGKKITLVVDL